MIFLCKMNQKKGGKNGMFFLIPTSVVRLPPHVFTFTFLLRRGIFWFLHPAAFRTEELDIKATPHTW
jgi:hypothetical protein